MAVLDEGAHKAEPSTMASKEAHGSGVPIQPAAKSTKAEPQVNSDVEMGSMPNAANPAEDIMQLARIGDVPAMEKLFESEKYDATYSDDEGITALHVRAISCAHAEKYNR